jgi:NADPH2:quinone reductase
MRAICIHSPDGPDAAVLEEVPDPEPNTEVLIEVHVAGVSFPELLMSLGQYQLKPDYPFIPGAELAGVVLEAPPDCHVRRGDRVAAISVYGAWAERAVVAPPAVFRVPDNLSLAAAAAIPMNYLTMHFALLRRAGLRAGDWVLVHGAAGGIGTAAIQVARAYGARVIAVASTDEKRALAARAGAHHTVGVAEFRSAVEEITEGRGVDIVADPVGGDRVTDSLRSLAPEGRLLVLGFTGGDIPAIKANRLLLNNVSVVGAGWGAFWASRPAYLAEQWQDLQPHLASGVLAPVLGQRFALEDAAEALRTVRSRAAMGKVLLDVRVPDEITHSSATAAEPAR